MATLEYYDPVDGLNKSLTVPASWNLNQHAKSQSTSNKGVTDASDPAAGQIGEFVTKSVAVGSAVSLSTATAKDVLSQALTAGDWEVWGTVVLVGASATAAVTGAQQAGISGTADTLPATVDLIAQTTVVATTSNFTVTLNCPRQRMNVNATTTYHMVVLATFTAGTATAYGTFYARRIR